MKFISAVLAIFVCSVSYATTPNLENPSFLPLVHTLPVIKITTENHAPLVSKEDYLKATMDIITKQGVQSYSLQVKGRGNSTWQMPKKPFRLKLDKNEGLLGMTSDKDWALLANYADKTLLRTQIAFNLSKKLNLAWTPDSRYVEVFLNAQYLGLYQLTETIKVAPHRVDLAVVKAKDNLPPKESGYLLEIDQREDAEFCFRTALKDLPLCLKSPDPGTLEQQTYITKVINDFETLLFNPNFNSDINGYVDFIDVDSFINFYLVSEISKNVDAKSFSSIYLYKNKNGKITMGPLWDFDLSFGNADYNTAQDPTGFWVKLGPWYQQLFSDPKFEAKVKARYKNIRQKVLDQIDNEINTNAVLLDQGQINNFNRWTILDQYVWPNPIITGSYNAEIQNLKTWIKNRLNWLDQEWLK